MQKLPDSVQRQLDAAENIVAQINSEPQPVSGELANTVPATTATVDPQPATTPQSTDEPWEQRYKSLRGMYDADVPRLHAQTRELSTQVQSLVTEIESIKATPVVEPPQKSNITDEDREAFGPDLINLIERAAEDKVQTLRSNEAKLVAEIAQLKSQVGKVADDQAVTGQAAFLDQLTKASPGWQAKNTDPGFLAWLAEVDPLYGFPRKIALDNAYGQLQVTRVAAFFNSYASTAPATAAPASDGLLSQVAPTTSRSSSVPNDPAAARTYTNASIEKFYKDVRSGAYTDAQVQSIEQDINAAAAEGRIR